MDDLDLKSVIELREFVKANSLESDEVLKHFANKIKKYDRDIGSFVQIATSTNISNFNGMVISVKSNIAVEGFKQSAGMKLLAANVAKEDAQVIKILKESGALIIGIVNMEEAAVGAKTDNPFFGATQNPIEIGYTPGGSSGGSAASVAAKLCNLSLGTDTLGSVRIPAAYCGLWGLKPSKGLIPKKGLIPLCNDYDEIGPIALNAEDIYEFMRLFIHDITPKSHAKIATLRTNHKSICEPFVFKQYQDTVQNLKANRNEILEFDFNFDLTKLRRSAFYLALKEANEYFAKPLKDNPESFSQELRNLLKWADGFDLSRQNHATELVQLAKSRILEIIDQTDFLITPTTPQVAFRHDLDPPVSQADYTALANISGLPALSIPVFGNESKFPAGIQLIGKLNSDLTLVDFASKRISFGKPT